MSVYGKCSLDVCTVNMTRVNGNSRDKRENGLSDSPHHGRLAATLNECKTKYVDIVITADRRITTAKLNESSQVCHGSVSSSVVSIDF